MGRRPPRRPAPPIAEGDVFRIRDTGPADDPTRSHAHIVIHAGGGDVVTVPVCSRVEGSDATCEIEVGEADARIVRRPSCIEYRLGRKAPATTFADMVADDPGCAMGRVPGTLYDRVIAGLGESPRSRAWARRLHFAKDERRRILRAAED